MIVDSSALLAIILAEPEEQVFAEAIYRAAAPKMSTAAYVEVSMKLDGGEAGLHPILDASLANLGIRLVPLSEDQGRLARSANVRFGRQHLARLNFGDCLTYALAKATGEPLLFKGDDFSHTDLPRAIAGAVEGATHG